MSGKLIVLLAFTYSRYTYAVSVQIILYPFAHSRTIRKKSPGQIIRYNNIRKICFTRQLFRRTPICSFHSEYPEIIRTNATHVTIAGNCIMHK